MNGRISDLYSERPNIESSSYSAYSHLKSKSSLAKTRIEYSVKQLQTEIKYEFLCLVISIYFFTYGNVYRYPDF